MATTFSLSGTVRTEHGKGAARRIRADRGIPAVLYGKGTDPVLLRLDEVEFRRAVTGHAVSNMILDLTAGAEKAKAMIREIQVDPVTREVLHVDLQRISMTEKIEIEIPVELVGVPEGVKTYGGVLQNPVRSIVLRCLASDVPEKIEVDVSAMGLGEALHAGDIDTGGLELVSDSDLLVAAVSAPSVHEEPAAEEAEEAAAPGEEEKKEGEGEPEKKEGE